jgi:hypothetical protein
MTSKSNSIWRFGNALYNCVRILWLRSTLGNKIEFTYDIWGPFRAYVRGTALEADTERGNH